VGAALEDFNAKAPGILRSVSGMSGFPSVQRTANMLEFGNYAAPPPEGAEKGQ
jgi:hypothetical protein